MGHVIEDLDLENFINLHRGQLESSGVPPKYWSTLLRKLHHQEFDINRIVCYVKIMYDDDEEKEPHEPTALLEVKQELLDSDPEHIYLIDHSFTFKANQIRSHLLQNQSARERLAKILDVDLTGETETVNETLERNIWRICNFYCVASAEDIEDRLPIWYVMDETGCAVLHSDEPNCRIVPFFYQNNNTMYSLLFPIKTVEKGAYLFRDYVEGIADPLLRKALLLPWHPSSLSDVNPKPEVPGADYYISGHIPETLPKLAAPNILPLKEKYKVFTEYRVVKNFLTNSQFELVESEEEADILWLTRHFKDFANLSETPNKFINQFPYEYVLTIKDLLALTCRKAGEPQWFPVTYNLKTEILNFVSYFQNREQQGLDNYWIIKPYNLARSLDIYITNNLVQIMRLRNTGPKIVQKYITNPVLFNRPECSGAVKFDVRYVILLKSIKPVVAYVYKEFFLRFANLPYENRDFDVYDKHFTVMNYREQSEMKHLRAEEFKVEWQRQFPSNEWQNVETKILKMLKEILECACKDEPPCGIGENPQSRALYAADIILEWQENREIQPKILEINWTPDCQRACQYNSDFYNIIFDLLFLNKENDEHFIKL